MGNLVLTRRMGEKLYIGEAVVTFLEKKGANAVRIAIEAPKDVRVLRGELVAEPNHVEQGRK